ncbi:MAG: phage scaffolding protein [Oscillospiraceae bacterium]|nr:phage scaffolding protein [Oscillospiraceae bacterium]
MEFLKDLFGTGALTFEQFTKAVEDKGLKIADLSAGEYVSKQKHEDELQAKDEQINTLNGNIKTRDGDIADLQNKLKDAGGDADTIKNLTTELETLKTKYDNDTKEYQKKLSEQAYGHAVREFANGSSFTSEAAKREFIRVMTEKGLTMEGDTIMGAADFLETYKKDNADSFVSDETKTNPKFVDTTKGQGGTGGQPDPFLSGFGV